MLNLSHSFLISLLFIGYADDVAALATRSVHGDGTAITADVISSENHSLRERSELLSVSPAGADDSDNSFPSPLTNQGPACFILRSVDPLFAHMSLRC